MMRMKQNTILAKILLISGFLAFAHGVHADVAYLKDVQVKIEPGETIVKLLTSGQVRVATKREARPDRLLVFLGETRSDLSTKEQDFSKGPLAKFTVGSYLSNPPVAQISLFLRDVDSYKIQQIDNAITIHIKSKRNPVAEKSSAFIRAKAVQSSILDVPGKITMNYHDAEIPNILRLLSAQNDVNIVAGNDVQGKVTVSLQNVSLREALNTILKANGYDYLVQGNVILVKKMSNNLPGELVTRVFHLKYVDANNLKQTLDPLKSKEGSIEVFDAYFQKAKKQQQKPGQPQQVAAGLSQSHSSVLIVTDKQEKVAQISQVISQLDVPVPQIMIESKLVEMSPVNEDRLGIDWDKTINASLLWQQVLPGGKAQSYSAMVNDPRSGQWNLGHLTASEFKVVLDFLREHTDSKLISNPRITAMDNQEATISVGTTFPIPQINRGLAGQGDIVTFNYKDVNIELRVTPHVSENRKILMSVNPVIEEVTGEVVVDVNRAPITSKRAVNTTVSVKDGETIVIGGMIKDNTTVTTSKVFLLGDIPLIGPFFRHQKKEKKQTDLIIFITPHIVEGE